MVPSHFHLPEHRAFFFVIYCGNLVEFLKVNLNIFGVPRQMVLLAGPRPKGAVPECTRDGAVLGSEAETAISI